MAFPSDPESRLRLAAEYRNRADTAQRAADASTVADAKRMFLCAASHYETLAQIAERWLDPPRLVPMDWEPPAELSH